MTKGPDNLVLRHRREMRSDIADLNQRVEKLEKAK